MSVISILGVDLGKIDSSSSAAFAVGTVVHTNDSRTAVYALTTAAINPTTTCTASANAVMSAQVGGRWISQNTTTTEANGYCWFATSGTVNL